MSLVDLIASFIKIAVLIGFCLGVGGALTWNDRRMSSMIQDRVGPNRARFLIPAWAARAMFAAPALLIGGAVAAWGVLWREIPSTAFANARANERIVITFELAVLFLWIGLAMLTAWSVRRGPANALEEFLAKTVKDPRKVFYAGVVVHVAVFVLPIVMRGSALAKQLKPQLFWIGPVTLGLVVAAMGLVGAAKVPSEGFKLRLIGLLHTMADGLKMIWKEDFVPKHGDKILHSVAPMIALFPPLVVLAVIPFGDVLCFATDPTGKILISKVLSMVPREGVCAEGAIPMQVASLDVGILFIFAIAGTGVLGAAIGGWASDNKYSLLGALRAAGQMVSYEITLGLTLVGLFMIYGTLRPENMVWWQGQNAWGIFVQPVAFFLFFIAAIAETKRIPFDLPEGESEIVGYFTEYSSMKFGMFFFAEYIEVVTSSAIMVTLFLGGWNLPFLHRDGITVQIGDTVLFHYGMSHLMVVIISVIAFFTKVLAFAWVQVVIRWTLPRFRYDQLMKLCWRALLPLSLVNILVTGVVLLVIQNTSVTVRSALDAAGDLTQVVVAVAMIAGGVAAVRWLLSPVRRQPVVLSTSAEMVARMGRTITRPMQA